MKPVKVLITREFSETWVDQFRAQVPAGIEIIQQTAALPGEISAELWKSVNVLYSGACYPDPADAPLLEWVQLDTAGVNHILETPLWRSQVKLTTLNGVAPPNMGEFAISLMLTFGHRLHRLFKGQSIKEWPTYDERWEWYTPHELRGSIVGVVGYGNIGREIGRLAHAFGMRVLAVDRIKPGQVSSLTYQIPELIGLPGTEPDAIYPPEELYQVLPQCDFVILVVPYTTETHHMIDESALQKMRPDSVLINIARGGVVDETALIRALQEKWLAGAALDVFAEEPLPASSPLWDFDNVVITPHIAGFTSHYHERIMDLFSQNLTRFASGQPLLNEVQRKRQF